MAETLLSVVKQVARAVGLSPSITAFFDGDETNDLVQDVNNGYHTLLQSLPKDCVYLLEQEATFNTANGIQTYNKPDSALSFNIAAWSFRRLTPTPIFNLTVETYESALRNYPDFTTKTGKPEVVVLRDTTLQLYPIPDGVYEVNYKYSTANPVLVAPTDTFIIPDNWVRFVTKYAQYQYEQRKGFGNTMSSLNEAKIILTQIQVDNYLLTPTVIYSTIRF